MKITQLTIQANITIDNREAELLEYLTSYNLVEWFKNHCSHRYTLEEWNEGLSRLRSKLSQITQAYDKVLRDFKG